MGLLGHMQENVGLHEKLYMQFLHSFASSQYLGFRWMADGEIFIIRWIDGREVDRKILDSEPCRRTLYRLTNLRRSGTLLDVGFGKMEAKSSREADFISFAGHL